MGSVEKERLSPMLLSSLETANKPGITVLCLGSHPDDIEIGCGGTIIRLVETFPQISVGWIVFSAGRRRRSEAEASAADHLRGVPRKTVSVRTFRESFFPSQLAAIKKEFERLKRDWDPDVIFTHYRHDLHQDHRIISDLTWNTWRRHLIFEYEIPKYDGDLGSPNVFVPLDKRIGETKVIHLMRHFATQRSKAWFTEDTFWAMMRIRGVEANSPTAYAEAFHCRKLVLR
ncbi:putative LmbE-like protein [Nitrospira japonica]|uniref:Putative LmbE-like protein n=2 Tax=Nitrospira japonica TaxID=1325564 RepID=A0A1W1IAD5_9BACT|nr:putative LmbE-like protein [Nitrospira japonica]